MIIKEKILAANEQYDYLRANHYIKDFSVTQSIAAATRLGLFDLLSQNQTFGLDDISMSLNIDKQGLGCLLGILCSAQIMHRKNNRYSLTSEFYHALKYHDFIIAQIEFANFIASDVIDFFPLLLGNEEDFMREAKLFELFDYSRAIEHSEKNYSITKRWMRFTTALTRYEARVCNSHHDFSQYCSMMDVGGNSGEFVLQLCLRNPELKATVVDLPVVCDIGREHVAKFTESDRIQFVPADALRHQLPQGFDLISFKSILHDWPEQDVSRFIHNAAKSLNPGGKMMIFERDIIDYANRPIPYYLIPLLLFFRSFRSPTLYVDCLQKEGFVDISIERLQLETPFYIVTATKY